MRFMSRKKRIQCTGTINIIKAGRPSQYSQRRAQKSLRPSFYLSIRTTYSFSTRRKLGASHCITPQLMI